MDWNKFNKSELIQIINKMSNNIDNKIINDIYNSFNIKINKKQKEFDFKKFHQRHIALNIYYNGRNYDGFAAQESTKNTIEDKLFYAFKKSCLIENRETSNYNRSGRTDKGVSASCQCISLYVRSNLRKDCEFVDNNIIEDDGKERIEYDYPKILNSLLPNDIRVISWSPVKKDFSSRFSTKTRTYRYYFIRRNLDIDVYIYYILDNERKFKKIYW